MASFCLFSDFLPTNIKKLQQITVENVHPEYGGWDLNPRPSKHEFHPITTTSLCLLSYRPIYVWSFSFYWCPSLSAFSFSLRIWDRFFGILLTTNRIVWLLEIYSVVFDKRFDEACKNDLQVFETPLQVNLNLWIFWPLSVLVKS